MVIQHGVSSSEQRGDTQQQPTDAASEAKLQAPIAYERKRVEGELDRRVAERTRELAEANAELQLQVGLLQHLPVSTWTLRPDGTPVFVNRVWLEFSGQTLDFVRSHPEAWMTAVHPEDREAALRAFWDGVHSGMGFAFEARSLRAQDRTYRWHLHQAVPLRDAEGRILKFIGTTNDIDDQKRAEDAQRASENNFRQIVDGIPGLVTTLNPSGEMVLVNRRFLDYYGKTMEEMKGWATNDAIHPDDRARSIAIFAESMKTGNPRELELRCRRADGVYRWFQLTALPVRDTEGRITGWYVLMTDIDDRKHIEEELRASENNLRQILDSIPGLVGTLSPAGEVELVNRQSLDFFGLTLEQLASWRSIDIIHPEDMPRVIANLGEALRTGAPRNYEIRYRRADGEYRWFQICISPVRDAAGRITRWYTFSIDVHERKCAEEELRRSEAFLAQGQRLNLTGTFAWNLETDEWTFSEQLYRIFELDPDAPVTPELIGTRVHPEDIQLLREKVELARKEINDLDYGIRLRMPDGRIKYLRTKSYGIQHLDGSRENIGAIQDVTEQRLAEEALNELRTELAHMARVTTIGNLTASIAHEVNQPLAGIVTNARTCLRTLSADPPNIQGAREAAQRLIRDGNRASEVIARLRTLFTKKETTIDPVDLNEATREIIALSMSELQRDRVILRQELADDLPLVAGDRVQLQQVILNLLRNASDALSGIDDRPRELAIRTERDEGDGVRLTVKDTGVGIAPLDMERLFDAFYTTKSDGMGMGLSVSRSIIESHHGRLWVESNDGPGAAFSFSLPRMREGLVDDQNIGSTGASGKTDPAKLMNAS
jgi:PAS domain S-box-containing protein